MRIALVGTSHVHATDFIEVCAELPWAQLVGIADVATAAPPLPGVDKLVVPSVEDLPAHDVAVLVTDIASHDATCRRVGAEMLFVEKPLGLDGARSARIARYLSETGQHVETGFFLRHSPAFSALTEAVRSGRLGAVRHLRMSYGHPGLLAGWLRNWPAHLDVQRMGGGPFTDLGVHLVDAARAIVGELDVTGVDLNRPASEGDVDVQGQIMLRGGGGELVHVWASGVAPSVVQRVNVICERGTLVLDAGRLEYREGDTREILHDVGMPTPASGFRSALERFRKGAEPLTRLQDAVAASGLMDDVALMANG